MERLHDAAQEVADLLLPVAGSEPDGDDQDAAGYLAVRRARFAGRPGLSLSAAVRRRFLALDLAGACLFSQRPFARDVVRVVSQPTAAPGPSGDLESLLRARKPMPVNLDDSEIFENVKFMQSLG